VTWLTASEDLLAVGQDADLGGWFLGLFWTVQRTKLVPNVLDSTDQTLQRETWPQGNLPSIESR
jgi:hypothetical protein